MKHKVNFTTKIIDECDPNFKLLAEKSKNFETFSMAMKFVRELKSRVNAREVLIGHPLIEAAA